MTMKMIETVDQPPTSAEIAIDNLKATLLALPAGDFGSVSASWARPNGMIKTVTLTWTLTDTTDDTPTPPADEQ